MSAPILIQEADCSICARHSRSGEIRACPVCGRRVALTADGRFRAHPRSGPRCAGVGALHSTRTIVTGEFVGATTGYRLTSGCKATLGRNWREIPESDPRHHAFVAEFLRLVAERGP